MVMSLLETQHDQPDRYTSLLDDTRNTPVNNPYLGDYWTNYNALQNNFALDPSQYTKYRFGELDEEQPSSPGTPNAVAQGRAGNSDVYGSPDRPGRDTVPSTGDLPGFAQELVDKTKGLLGDMSFDVTDLPGIGGILGTPDGTAPGTTVGDFSYGEEDGPLSAINDQHQTGYGIGAGLGLGVSTLGGALASGITGISEMASLNDALGRFGVAERLGLPHGALAMLPGPTLLGLANEMVAKHRNKMMNPENWGSGYNPVGAPPRGTPAPNPPAVTSVPLGSVGGGGRGGGGYGPGESAGSHGYGGGVGGLGDVHG